MELVLEQESEQELDLEADQVLEMEIDQGMVIVQVTGTDQAMEMETDQGMVVDMVATMADIIHIMDMEATMVAGVIGEVPC